MQYHQLFPYIYKCFLLLTSEINPSSWLHMNIQGEDLNLLSYAKDMLFVLVAFRTVLSIGRASFRSALTLFSP